ncbi:hypothetical protein CHARACLAT_011970, partial [Characodon lateralis]|nr:hypothetical protein [Characodon lateralis]
CQNIKILVCKKKFDCLALTKQTGSEHIQLAEKISTSFSLVLSSPLFRLFSPLILPSAALHTLSFSLDQCMLGLQQQLLLTDLCVTNNKKFMETQFMFFY